VSTTVTHPSLPGVSRQVADADMPAWLAAGWLAPRQAPRNPIEPEAAESMPTTSKPRRRATGTKED